SWNAPPSQAGSTFDNWDRERWMIHVRANPDGILAFGRQPFVGYPRNSFDLKLPYYILLPFGAVFATAALLKGIRKNYLAVSRCAVCGYDLRASQDRCPEC